MVAVLPVRDGVVMSAGGRGHVWRGACGGVERCVMQTGVGGTGDRRGGYPREVGELHGPGGRQVWGAGEEGW